MTLPGEIMTLPGEIMTLLTEVMTLPGKISHFPENGQGKGMDCLVLRVPFCTPIIQQIFPRISQAQRRKMACHCEPSEESTATR